jgi:tetratricopeptide (TPR) repeat protein
MIDIDDQNPMTYFNIGDCYYEMSEYEKAIPEFEKALEIFQKWGSKPFWAAFYYELGICYHKTGQYRKEKKLYKKAEQDFPDDPGMIDQHAWLALSLGDTASANRYIEKWISVRKEQSWSDARIAGYIGYIYSMAGIPDKEEEFRRKALSLEPGNTARMNSLAYFLIDKERNIEEGIGLCGKALKLNPEDFNSLFIKGWGLFKQHKYPESLELLQKSWDLRLQKSIYKHKPFLVLEEAKKAMGS